MPSGGTLAGLRVLDVTQVMAGPYCAMLLCDMGADVIKVEPRAGDSTRRMAGATGGDSPSFNAVNRGKRGIVIDLKSDAGRGVFERLASSADVLIENFRPGVMAGLGLDYATLADVNPRLIYASISGYGQTGPKATHGGFDLVAQGVSGIISVTGEPGRPPTKAGIPITDLGAALFATTGILAALHHRATTGRGQQIDTSLVDAGVAMSVWEATEYFSGTGVPAPLGSAHRMSAPYQAVKCSDGYITLGGANDRIFQRVCGLLGHAEWATDPDYVDDTARVRNRAALAKKIEGITETEPRDHWLELFEAHDIPSGPINNYAAVVDDPQVRAREMVVETEHPTLGTIRTLGSPLKLSATPVTTGRPAPLLGQHTDVVLREAGYDDAEIAKLRETKAVK
ncbi:MAG: CoA transferase [Vicinamibacterales bacterium]|jgi:formyl-CoA transferase|nr:CoA transferase [Acidobacteriota bacterium]MDP7293958.1 CoA transferase [Vicinamibacterales bacterium]MDP7472485.1 CoA transferase [Vicinamibacterales bacterium]MDP7671309.1 CoA transferase [Vicinamibacterales bacterium]HJO38535.1 CoA transferase [Vicinamibacterales bacterium]